jgi:branched-chain amino acid transport system permease protein
MDLGVVGDMTKTKIRIFVTLPIAIISLSLLPFFVETYILALLFSIFIYIILSESYNIIAGYTGYFNIGYVSFFGIGAYITALLITQTELPYYIAFVISGLMAVLFAVTIFSWFLRIRHPALFAMATLGIMVLLESMATKMVTITGGAEGLALPAGYHLHTVYYLTLILALVTVLVVFVISNSKLGLRFMAIRDDEDGAEVLGVDTAKYKRIALIISALFPGLAGSVYIWNMTYINPYMAFSKALLIETLIMAHLGGLGSVMGPIVGVIALTLTKELILIKFPLFQALMYGILIIAVTFYLPKGIWPLLTYSGLNVLKRIKSV